MAARDAGGQLLHASEHPIDQRNGLITNGYVVTMDPEATDLESPGWAGVPLPKPAEVSR